MKDDMLPEFSSEWNGDDVINSILYGIERFWNEKMMSELKYGGDSTWPILTLYWAGDVHHKKLCHSDLIEQRNNRQAFTKHLNYELRKMGVWLQSITFTEYTSEQVALEIECAVKT